jgi:hypothetical protein
MGLKKYLKIFYSLTIGGNGDDRSAVHQISDRYQQTIKKEAMPGRQIEIPMWYLRGQSTARDPHRLYLILPTIAGFLESAPTNPAYGLKASANWNKITYRQILDRDFTS